MLRIAIFVGLLAIGLALPVAVDSRQYLVVENLSTELLDALVINADVRAIWRAESGRYSTLVTNTHPSTYLGFDVQGPFEVAATEKVVISLKACSPHARTIFVQKDKTCVQASTDSFETLDQVEKRQDLIPELPIRLSPLPQKPSIVTTHSQNEKIKDLISKISVESQRGHLNYFTNTFNTRLSWTPAAEDASKWIKTQFEAYGLKSSLHYFKEGYAPVVEGILAGETASNKIIIIGAHLDDRSKNISDPDVRAPGANDDGSGVGMLLELALVASKYKFTHTIHFMAFTGEEQGLYGSKAYAEKISAAGAEVVVMLQGDMLAQRAVGEKSAMAIATQYSTDWLPDVIRQVATEYVPELEVTTTTSCCTDQLPFFNLGFPAIAVNEKGGYLIDPMYHNTGDVVDRQDYSVEQISLISKVILATAAGYAGIQ